MTKRELRNYDRLISELEDYIDIIRRDLDDIDAYIDVLCECAERCDETDVKYYIDMYRGKNTKELLLWMEYLLMTYEGYVEEACETSFPYGVPCYEYYNGFPLRTL
ncbi:hypothetical protein AGMMS49992_25830 [Clostridia bacterium]|nr:hypothetical protein AGMMS49992_25830 [Clostridia bacterium]